MRLYQFADNGKFYLENLNLFIEEYQQICQEADIEESQPIKGQEVIPTLQKDEAYSIGSLSINKVS